MVECFVLTINMKAFLFSSPSLLTANSTPLLVYLEFVLHQTDKLLINKSTAVTAFGNKTVTCFYYITVS